MESSACIYQPDYLPDLAMENLARVKVFDELRLTALYFRCA